LKSDSVKDVTNLGKLTDWVARVEVWGNMSAATVEAENVSQSELEDESGGSRGNGELDYGCEFGTQGGAVTKLHWG